MQKIRSQVCNTLPWFQLGLGQRIDLHRFILQIAIRKDGFGNVAKRTNVILIQFDRWRCSNGWKLTCPQWEWDVNAVTLRIPLRSMQLREWWDNWRWLTRDMYCLRNGPAQVEACQSAGCWGQHVVLIYEVRSECRCRGEWGGGWRRDDSDL